MDTPERMLGDISAVGCPSDDRPATAWLLRLAPAAARPYIRLMRLDRPIGIWLLLLPGWWSIALAGGDIGGNWRFFLLFGLGAIVMRGCGCIVNDILDRRLDARVTRTAGRPLASGTISIAGAALLMFALLAAGLAILLQFNHLAILLGFLVIPLVGLYPLMKRLTDWPQAWLGLTFNWGALLGWAAVRGQLDAAAFLLYGAGILWTLGYDTIYAHQDKDDDALVGIKSTALRLGNSTPVWLIGFYGGSIGLIAAAGASLDLGLTFWAGLFAAAGQLAWQIGTLKLDSPSDCLIKFRSNRVFGWIVLGALVAGSWG